MIFPKFLKCGDNIGITACSCGILDKLEKYKKTLEYFKSEGLGIVETANVYTRGLVSSDAYVRWKELKELYINDEVLSVHIASGGDFLSEMLSCVEEDVVRDNVKWVCGSSDATSLLYLITTKYDIATIYSPCNMSGMSSDILHESYLNYFSILKGNLIRQRKFEFYEGDEEDHFDIVNKWVSSGNLDVEGRLIGGCIEVLKDMIGTPYEDTISFLSRYKDDGFIWYFDVFNMSAEMLFNTLLQFKRAGWFLNVRAVLIGKVRFPSCNLEFSYEDAIVRALGDIPFIFLFDIGHVKPSFTMINGALAHVFYDGEDGYLEYLWEEN